MHKQKIAFVIQSYEYGAYGEVLSGDTKITPFLYNGQLGVMTDDNGLYYMRARYYNVNIKRFINQDVVHGSINVSQSLNRYSYVQGNPIKLTDPFGLSPLDKINWRNVGHSALNILGCISEYGFIFDGINAVWYACEGDYGMAALSLISTLSDTGNMIAFGLKSTKFARVGQYIGAITQLVSNAATFTQAAISGLENAKAIFRNAKSGKLLSIDTASNVAALGLNLFTTIVSGKEAVTSGKNIKKMIGTDVGNKWGNKANNKPLLECNLQFFGDKNGGKGSINSANGLIGHDFEEYLTKKIGGNGSFSAGGRDFDGGISNRWWEAKSGQYWDMLENNPNKLAKFKSDMGDRLRIATQNNASYEIFSNTPIPNSIKMWLTKKGIHYTEILD